MFTLFDHCLNVFVIKLSSVRVVCFALLRSRAMPPTWSNGPVMTNIEGSFVKKWILTAHWRKAFKPLRRELFLTHGRKQLPLFGVPVDLEDEQNTLNLCTDEVHSGKTLPPGPLRSFFLGAHSGKTLPANHVHSEPVHSLIGADPRQNTLNIEG